MHQLPEDPRAQLTAHGGTAELLDQLADIGFDASLRPGESSASVVCSACESVSAMNQFNDVWSTRLEGASDPDDMVLVVAARCPVCGDGGTIVLGFGPASSPEDADIVAEVPDHSMQPVSSGDL